MNEQIIPRAGVSLPERPYATPDKRWEEVTAAIYGSSEEVENLRPAHNPSWEREFFSVQNARNQAAGNSVGVWSLIGILGLAADLHWLWFRWSIQ